MIGRPWAIVSLLCLLATTSYLDRYIVALLADDIMRDLQVSHVQIGALIGISFGLLYSVISLPLAYFLDRGSRVRLVLGGVLLWSLCTMLSGFVHGYSGLLVLRAGVAVGEAVLTPAAISLIADLFPRDRRTLPTSLYMAISALMGAGSFVVGGVLFDIAARFAPDFQMATWRVTMTLVGLPGLVLAVIWAFVREPARQEARTSAASICAAAHYLWGHRRFYGLLYGGLGLSGLGSYAYMAWGVSTIIRSQDIGVADAGYAYGTIGLSAAVLASLAWPAMAEIIRWRGQPAAPIIALACGLAGGQACVATLFLFDSLPAMLGVMGVATFCFAAGGSLPLIAIQVAAPSWMRAKVVSLYVLVGNLIGLVFGPPACAALADRLFDGPDAMRNSLSLMGALLALPTLGVIAAARGGYLRAIASEEMD